MRVDGQGAIAIAVGVAGLAVSSWSAYLGWRDRRPRLAVSLAYGTTGDPGPASLALAIRVVNRGAVDVALDAVGLVTPDGHHLAFGELSRAVPARKSATFWISPQRVADTLRAGQYAGRLALRAYCLDAVGNEYRSAPVLFDVRLHLSDVPSSQS